ncbi:hypothetical protein BKA63DRAFT_254894 [Paraphoma chrysanthemicola]|nr:hypothetical protein BKA63DRAFT_254894 [Paraphoma chrysanthemicola]
MTQNYSLYTIPIYWAIALYPHMYAVSLIRTSISYDTWNMHNPRGQATAPSYQKLLSAATFARFERAEAAHANGMENASFFVGAVLAGCMGGVDACT